MPVADFIPRTRALLIHLTRPVRRKGWKHWLRFAALLLIGSYMGHLLSDSDRFTDWRYWLYQKQVSWERRGPVYPRYTALVLLNDDDYYSDQYQARSKYKRDQLAALLDRLNAAGVNTVAFDIFLTSPYPGNPTYEFPDYRAEDEALFAAIGRMCTAGRHVVLATEYWSTDPDADDPPRYEVPDIYMSHLQSLPCVTNGTVEFPNDMRKLPGLSRLQNGTYLDSFSLAITRIADPIAYQSLIANEDKGFRFAQFLTPEDFSTRDGRQFVFNGKDIESTGLNQLRAQLADKTVIVGGSYHVIAKDTGYLIDLWNSPGGLESGAMLHANYVEAMRDPISSFAPISDRAAEIIEWCLAMTLALIAALEIHAGLKWLGFFLTFLASVVLTYVLLQNLGIFLDFFIPIVIIVAHTMVESILEMRHELHRAKLQLHLHHQAAHESTQENHP